MKEARGAAASCAESSAIFDWALARRISACVRSSAARRSTSSVTKASSRVFFGSVPA